MQITVATTTVKRTGKNKFGKDYTVSEVVTTQGQKFDTFEVFNQGDTCDVEVTPNKDPKYNAGIKRIGEPKQPTPQQHAQASQQVTANEDEKQRVIAMESVIRSAAIYYQQRQGTETQMIDFARKLFDVVMKPANVMNQDDGSGLPF